MRCARQPDHLEQAERAQYPEGAQVVPLHNVLVRLRLAEITKACHRGQHRLRWAPRWRVVGGGR